MKVCYRKSDGVYCDNEQSWVKYPGDEAFIKAHNVMGRFKGKVTDYIVIETDKPSPWLKRYVNGKLIDDKEKLKALEAQKRAEEDERLKRERLTKKIKDKTATHEELLEYLALRQE